MKTKWYRVRGKDPAHTIHRRAKTPKAAREKRDAICKRHGLSKYNFYIESWNGRILKD